MGCAPPGQSQLAEVARQRCLRHVPTALEQQLAEIFLAAHHSSAYDLQDSVVSFTFVGHGAESSTAKQVARAERRDH